MHKINEDPQNDVLERVISAEYVVDILIPRFLILIILRTIFKDLDPLSYERYSKVAMAMESLKEHVSSTRNSCRSQLEDAW